MKKAKADNIKLSGILSFAVILLGLAYYLTGRIEVVIIFTLGILLVTAFVALFIFLQKRMERRKALKAGGSPGAAPPKDAAKAQEKLEELRRSFALGVDQFAASGRGIYDVPWFLMMGLSGVGKTEAIRNSGLSFPASLQDETQGEGGTRSLHWWFTSEAVILDSLGEWLLDEDAGFSEWIELFRLLKTHRPACPFNGVILAISSESLLLDNDEKIKEKAAMVARKLDAVQRLLEIRFPVFVIVTKCDLITGFRDFFDSEEAPPFQKKMLGWSNPAGLDDPFDAASLVDHFEPLFKTLKDHRLSLFTKEGGAEKRTPEGAYRIFAFPENLKRALGRLRIYLEAAFLPGEWSQKPLFIRGVFFTSAKQDGWELDVELADSFTIPQSSHISEHNPGRKREHFLFDVFREKIFQEKGLILRAASARSHQRRRKLLTWGTSFLVLAVFIFLTRLSFSQLQKAIGVEQGFWEAAAEKGQWVKTQEGQAWRPVVERPKGSGTFVYRAMNTIDVGEKLDTTQFLHTLAGHSVKPMDIPWIFRVSADISGNLDKARPEAARALFESSILVPIIDAVRGKLSRQKPDLWSEGATAALAQLLRIEVQRREGLTSVSEGGLIDFDILMRYVLKDAPADFDVYDQQHAKAFAETLAILYQEPDAAVWPPSSLGTDKPEAVRLLDRACQQFVLHWTQQIESQKVNQYLRSIAHLTEAGLLFADAEQSLVKVDAAFTSDSTLPATLLIHNRLTGTWERYVATLTTAGALIREYEGILATGTLERAYDEQGARAMKEVEGAFNTLLVQLAGIETKPAKESDTAKDGDKGKGGFLARLDRELKAKVLYLRNTFRSGKVREDIKRLDAEVYKVVKAPEFGRKAVRSYEARYTIYKMAHDLLKKRLVAPDLFSLHDAYTKGREEINAVKENFRSYMALLGSPDPRFKAAADTGNFGLRLAERVLTYAVVKSTLDSLVHNKTSLADQASRRAKAFEPVPRAPIFMARRHGDDANFQGTFHPVVMRELLLSRGTLVTLLGDPDSPEKPSSPLLENRILSRLFAQVDGKIKKYFQAYTRYWMDVLLEGFLADPFTWKEFITEIAGLQVWDVNEKLLGILNKVDDALKDPGLPLDKDRKKAVSDLRRNIQSSRDRLKALAGKDNPFAITCKTVIASWSGLRGESSEGARLLLLQIKPEKLMEKYIIQGSGRNKDVVLRYWESLTRQAVVSLANDFQQTASAELPKLPGFRAFPLAAPGAKRQLTADELEEARVTLDRVRPNPATLPGGCVGLGAETGVLDIDKILARLAMLEMPDEIKDWITKADPILAALPRKADGVFSCEVTLLKGEVQRNIVEQTSVPFESLSALLIWRSVILIQGKRTAAQRSDTDLKEDQVLGKFRYPGESIKFEFYQTPSDKLANRTIIQEGPWGPLLLLHKGEAKRWDAPEAWLVALVLKDDKGKNRKIWLRLAFDRALPDLKDWPSPR
jgi:hypothetical protein